GTRIVERKKRACDTGEKPANGGSEKAYPVNRHAHRFSGRRAVARGAQYQAPSRVRERPPQNNRCYYTDKEQRIDVQRVAEACDAENFSQGDRWQPGRRGLNVWLPKEER